MAADDVPKARSDPWAFISPDPLMDAWGPAEDRPPMLYLDKCWGLLQELTEPAEDGEAPRPAYRLFEGQVTHIYELGAWEAWTRVLDPDEIGTIARDIKMINDSDIRDMLARPGGYRITNDFCYLRQYLTDAQRFVDELVEKNSGAVYMIG